VKQGDEEFNDLPEREDDDSEIPKHVKLVLEEQPKWALLKNILTEIEQDSMTLNDGQGAPVLIMVAEKRTCSQLKDYITRMNENTPFLDKLAHSFFKWRVNIHKMQSASTAQQQHSAATTAADARGRMPPNKRRRVRGGSTTAIGSGRSHTIAETFRNDVIENVTA
jgi:DNA excision repair protein ERCC-4